ncbi:MAG TPA: hypothetical protein PKI32_06130 [Opitutales bacterium]|nr:hypothetical protein [Opitutales bacterium]
MENGAKTKPNSFLLLAGREFASGVAEWNGERLEIGHYVHIAGKELEDAEKDLKAHLGTGIVAAQATMPVSFCDASTAKNHGELLDSLAGISGLAADNLSLAFFDKGTGAPIAPGESLSNALAVGINKMLIERRKAELSRLGVSAAVTSCRVLNALGALKQALANGTATGPVLCASVLPASTQLFLISRDNIEDLGAIDHGYASILMQIMSALNLKFEGSAARLFFGNIYDFGAMGDSLSAPLSAKIKARLDSYRGESPKSLMISGLPPARTRMLARHIATSVKLEALALPILVEAREGGLPTLPAIGAPSMVHMFRCATGLDTTRSMFLDINKTPAAPAEYWNVAAPAHPVIHMYRGTAFDTAGKPAEATPHEKPAAVTAGGERRILRFYRGTPVYADADDVAHNVPPAHPAPVKPEAVPVAKNPIPAEKPAAPEATPRRRIIRMYRGTPVYADE